MPAEPCGSPMTGTKRRYPWEPLQAKLDARLGIIQVAGQEINPNDVRRAGLLGVDKVQIGRWRKSGMMGVVHAVRSAEAAGFIPYEVWPEMLDEQIAELERRCARSDCTRMFIDIRGLGSPQRFCSERCQIVERDRRRAGRKIHHAPRTCAAGDCCNLFVPAKANSLYCTARCRARVQQRRSRLNPVVQERDRMYSARYYAEAGDYVRARQRAASTQRRAA